MKQFEPQTKYTLYIGSDNKTKSVCKALAKEVLNKYFEAYTIINAEGLYKKESEESILVELLYVSQNSVLECAKELAKELKQYEIYVTKSDLELLSVEGEQQ